MKRKAMWCSVLFLGAMLGGFLAQYLVSGNPCWAVGAGATVAAIPDVLTVERIELVDDKGRLRAVFGLRDDGRPFLKMVSPAGRVQLQLMLRQDHAGEVWLLGQKGELLRLNADSQLAPTSFAPVPRSPQRRATVPPSLPKTIPLGRQIGPYARQFMGLPDRSDGDKIADAIRNAEQSRQFHEWVKEQTRRD